MRKFLSLIVVLSVAGTVLAGGGDAQADYWDGANCYPNQWGDVVCAEDWVAEAVWSAANYYGVDGDWLMLVAACESNFDWTTVGPFGEVGLFQFMPDTWEWMSGGYGSPYEVWDSAYVAAWAFSQGLWTHWTCAWLV